MYCLYSFEHLGFGLGLTERQVTASMRRFERNQSIAFKWIENSFLSDGFKDQYKNLMAHRYTLLA